MIVINMPLAPSKITLEFLHFPFLVTISVSDLRFHTSALEDTLKSRTAWICTSRTSRNLDKKFDRL